MQIYNLYMKASEKLAFFYWKIFPIKKSKIVDIYKKIYIV